MAADGAARARAAAAQYGVPFDEKLIDDTYPLSLEPERIDLWEPYRTHGARERFARRFLLALTEGASYAGCI